jgi:hypothetical protein
MNAGCSLATYPSMMRLILVFSAIAILPCLALAKHAAPSRVEPVIHDGSRYVAPNDDGRRAYIEARDVQTNKKLWELTVFTNRIDPRLEEDVQWVFINKLNVLDDTLLVTSERGNTYRIDLSTKAITQSDLEQSPAPDAAAQRSDIPEAVKTAIANGSLAKNYELSFHMNPFYLRGDFNGDGKADIAVLVKQRSTVKLGIAIINGATDKVTVVGAGNAIGNGGDNFEWMDSWQVYSEGRAAQAAGGCGPKLHGDALLVSKSEAASALIYWNGKRYVWFQQGD